MKSPEKIKKYLLSLTAVCFVFSLSMAQDISGFKSKIYASYAEGNMEEWKNVMDEMEEIQIQSYNKEFLYELLIAQYGYIGYCINENRKKEASRVLNRAQDRLGLLIDKEPANASLMALEGAFMGYEMGINKLKAVITGPKAKEKIDAAVEKDPEAVRTLLEKANQLNFSPGLFGGDTRKAIAYYHKAINKMEDMQAQQKDRWIYVNTLVVLAATYEKMGNYTHACAVYEKIMNYDPDIKWVKEDLYPACSEKAEAGRYPGP